MASTTKNISGEDESPVVPAAPAPEVKKEEAKPEAKAPAPAKETVETAEPVESAVAHYLTDEDKFKIREGIRIG